MFKIQPVNRVQYQRLLIDKDRALKRLQGFRKLRIILLKTVFALLINVQRTSQYATSNQALQSLKQCRDWLTDCLETIQRLHNRRSECNIVAPNIEFKKSSHNVLGRYIASLKKVLSNYENYQTTMHPMAHRTTARNNLKKMLIENIGVMQLAIRMLRLFMKMSNNVFFKAHDKKMSSKKVRTGKCNNGQIFLEKKESTVGPQFSQANLSKQSIETRCSQRDEDSISGIDQPAVYFSFTNIAQPSDSTRHRGGGRESSRQFLVSRIDHSISVTSQTYLKSLHKLKKKISSVSKTKLRNTGSEFISLFKFNKYHEWDKPSPRMSVVSEEVKTDTMMDTATAIINKLFSQKSAPRAVIKKVSKYKSVFELHNLNENKRGIGKVDEVWQDLLSEHNQQLLTSKDRKISDIKEDLTKFYLIKMQLILQTQINKMNQRYKKKKRLNVKMSSSFSMVVPVVKNDWKTMEKSEILLKMHKIFYTAQLKKLSRERYNPKIPRLESLIMSEELPKSASEHNLLQEYGRDPHFYNVLIMSLHRDSEQDGNVLATIEHNFERIMCQLARHKRQERMWQYSLRSKQPSFETIETLWREDKVIESAGSDHVFVFDEDYCRVERAKWAKYFADQEKTPTMQHLEHIREQKRLARSVQRRSDRKSKILQKTPKRRRPITALYTAPRLTHRMRQAVDQIAEEAQVSMVQHMKKVQQSTDLQADTMPLSEEEEKGLNIADLLLDSASWTSSCSKCRIAEEAMPSGSALEQFFRTHEQILQFGDNFCICHDTSAEKIW